MAINNFHEQTFVAFLDISGFKELMKNDNDALKALNQLYQAGYDVLQDSNGVEGFFVSDCGILFVRDGSSTEKLKKILVAVKSINQKMLHHNYILTTSIAYGAFDYQGKLEFDGIEKNRIYGNAYVKAFLDNEKGLPRIQPGQCRVVAENLPQDINLSHTDFPALLRKGNDTKYFYFYWSVQNSENIADFERRYNDSYKLKYAGILQALKNDD